MTKNTAVNPESLPRPSGFSYAFRSEGRVVVHFAGHTAMNAEGVIEPGQGMLEQVKGALENLRVTARAADVEPSDFSKLTIYVTDVEAYRASSREIGEAYQSVFGRHFPAMTLVQIGRLWDAEAMVEIDGVAVVE